MAPRTILYTGKGGVGTSAVSAATARRCAAGGQRTLVLSTGPGLAFALDTELGTEPEEISPRLWAQRVCARAELARHWGAARARLGGVVAERAVPDALTLLPGLDGLLGLLVVADHHETGSWDVVVVDCPPPEETLRLLVLPEAARWWLEHIAAPQGRLLLDEVSGIARTLVALGGVLRDHDGCSVRLVVAPERGGSAAARRTLTSLHLHAFGVDAVVVNRILPPEAGAYFDAWRERQQEELHALEKDLAPVPVLRAPFFAEEVAGPAMLDRLAAALFPEGTSAPAVLHAQRSPELVMGRDGATLGLALPFAEREALRLQRIGSELILAVEGHRRSLPLPPALADYRATGARFQDGLLLVAFDPPA
jgi:arsenite-transporting ATPase